MIFRNCNYRLVCSTEYLCLSLSCWLPYQPFLHISVPSSLMRMTEIDINSLVLKGCMYYVLFNTPYLLLINHYADLTYPSPSLPICLWSWSSLILPKQLPGILFLSPTITEQPYSLQVQSSKEKAQYFPIWCIWVWVWNTPNASRCESLRIVWFYIESKQWTKVDSNIAFSLEHREFDSTFSVAPLTSDMPSPDSIALLPSNCSYSTYVWYDRVAFFSTRGFVNIYHNAEWIANFYHIATNIEKLLLVW